MRVLFQSPTPAMPLPPSSIISNITTTTSGTNPLRTLQKSISSTSLKIAQDSSSDSSSCASSSHSAPVSRQQSHELSTVPVAVPELTEIDACCMTPLKVISAAAQQLISVAEKKSVAWDDCRLQEIEEYSNPCTPVQQSSRYKSEPNLCSLRPQVHDDDDEDSALTPIVEVSTTTSSGMGKSLTRKLMKGVSMGNLRFPFSTPETTKRLVRSVSATLKRRPSGSDELKQTGCHLQSGDGPLLEDMDDSDLDVIEDDTLSNELPSMTVDAASSYHHQQLLQSSVYRNLDLITSTPSLRMGRRSMSPITKSTQRMPKAMQVSGA